MAKPIPKIAEHKLQETPCILGTWKIIGDKIVGYNPIYTSHFYKYRWNNYHLITHHLQAVINPIIYNCFNSYSNLIKSDPIEIVNFPTYRRRDPFHERRVTTLAASVRGSSPLLERWSQQRRQQKSCWL